MFGAADLCGFDETATLGVVHSGWAVTSGGCRSGRGLGEGDRKRLREVRQLVREVGVCVEVQVPGLARKSPVPDIGDPPDRRRLEIDDEIDASAVGTVPLATAEDHLTSQLRPSALARRESKWDEGWIE